MIALLQRVKSASVEVNEKRIAEIDRGILVLLGFERQDTEALIERLLERIVNYRIFSDEAGKMNLSLRDISGGLLVVPQFTLAADTNRGNRPSFTSAAPPELGLKYFEQTQKQLSAIYPRAEFGEFGADMQVSLINDGPVTFWLQNST